METPEKLKIDVWSDIACPWCYVGKRRLEAALAKFPDKDQVEVVWHAFELDTSAPVERDPQVPQAARLAEKYGRTIPEAEGMLSTMTETARADGLDFHFERMRSGNTFDAHRVIHLGHERGIQDAVKERFLRAYMTEGESIGDRETLVRLGAEAGLDANEVRNVLESETYTAEVRADERTASEIGIRGVPFFVLGGRYAVSGAQPAELLLRAISQAWEERVPKIAKFDEAGISTENPACGPEGCT